MKKNFATLALLTLAPCYLINAADSDSSFQAITMLNISKAIKDSNNRVLKTNNPFILLTEKEGAVEDGDEPELNNMNAAFKQFGKGILFIHTLSKSKDMSSVTLKSVMKLVAPPEQESPYLLGTPKEGKAIKYLLYEINEHLNKSPETSENEDPVSCLLLWMTQSFASRAHFTLPNTSNIYETHITTETNPRFTCLMLTNNSETPYSIEENDIKKNIKENESILTNLKEKIFSSVPGQYVLLIIDHSIGKDLILNDIASDNEQPIKSSQKLRRINRKKSTHDKRSFNF